MNARPKLLIVGAFPRPGTLIFGGIISSCRALLQSSLSKRVELSLVDSTQISNPPPAVPLKVALAVRRMLTYVVQFEQFKPDAVMLFASAGASMLEKGLLAHYARLRGVPTLFFPRSGRVLDYFDDSVLHRWLARFALDKPTRILCQGEQWQTFVVDKLHRPTHIAPLIRNWTATPELLAIGDERRDRRPNGSPRVLFVGWLDRSKGVLDLLSAISRLPSELRPKLDLVGEGDVSVAARAYVQAQGLTELVRFRGWLVGEDLIDAYRTADVFVLPSWFEGLPNAMIEAMAARLAVIVSSVGNIPSVIVDGKNGLLIPPKNVDALTTALIRMLEDESMRCHLADQAYTVASEQFGVERAVQKLADILQEVTGIPVPREGGRCSGDARS